jgi:molecular chaperone HscB
MPSATDSTDYFSFLGLPRRLNLDIDDLERRYRALSRQFHPDYFYNASAAERRASLERSSYLNDAYRTLRNPVVRIEYLLTLEGAGRNGTDDTEKCVPAALLEEVFALNEELDEIRAMRETGSKGEEWQARLDRARHPIEAKRADHEAELHHLMSEWDAVVDGGGSGAERQRILHGLRERMLERNYIERLLAGIETTFE